MSFDGIGNREMKIGVSLPTDEHGFIGRKCPQCKKYFKVKFGTGLHSSECNCPYCEFAGDHQEFATDEQVKYAESVAMKKFEEEVLEPLLQDFERNLKRLEDATRGGFIQIKVESHRSPMTMPLNTYQEKKLKLVSNAITVDWNLKSMESLRTVQTARL
jgi:hypothetical protein